ncbi:uncharacterized protein LOC130719731 [Lotus japonicus]|uniref:uncharacterized protein LOC130719731 n=1 Tax=Lotus japonicus TaxID=34305 RepID=UPI002583EE2E|nr:uncharacterized protein LOC130719731 [Lotus japonicus]
MVSTNSGFFMAANNEFKINLIDKTKAVLEEDPLIPLNMFTFKNSEEIIATGGDYNYLIDIIGLVTNVSKEKQYNKGCGVTRMIEMELTDDKGKIQCALFGNYVDVVKELVASNGYRMAVVILQFVKVKTFKGDVVLQNVMNATNVIWNPTTQEVATFRDGLAIHGIESDELIADIADFAEDDDIRVIPLGEEFLTLYPRKTIQQLNTSAEDGVFVVRATILDTLDSCTCRYIR